MVNLPNHCLNVLSVTGAASEIATFINHGLQRDGLEESITSCPDLNFLYPIPASVEKADDPGILSTTEYNWKTENWGTKWNTYSDDGIHIRRSETTDRLLGVSVSFETAWAPAEGAIEVGSAKFPHLFFTYEYAEPGMMFKGVSVYQNGEVIFKLFEAGISDAELESDSYSEMDSEDQLEWMDSIRTILNPEKTTHLTSFTGDML